jgi:hypothetical protein
MLLLLDAFCGTCVIIRIRVAVLPLQALWTQAREQLQVLTIICANNTYAILKVNSSSTALNQCCRTFKKRSMLLW